MPPCLTLNTIRYRSSVSGAIPGKEWRPPLFLGVVANEKEAFGSPSATIDQLMYTNVFRIISFSIAYLHVSSEFFEG